MNFSDLQSLQVFITIRWLLSLFKCQPNFNVSAKSIVTKTIQIGN